MVDPLAHGGVGYRVTPVDQLVLQRLREPGQPGRDDCQLACLLDRRDQRVGQLEVLDVAVGAPVRPGEILVHIGLQQ